MKRVAWLIGGFIFSAVAVVVVALATFSWEFRDFNFDGVAVFINAEIAAVVITLTAPSAGKAWRRLFALSGVMCLSLPLALVFKGSASAGGVLILLRGYIGFFFVGAFLIIVGLLCGRSPQAVIVQPPPNQ